jgi:hypothetical protein
MEGQAQIPEVRMVDPTKARVAEGRRVEAAWK